MQIPIAYQPLNSPKRYKVYYGGRGSGKSNNFALTLIIMAYHRPLRVLCTREVQKSIKESVHKELCDAISMLENDPSSIIPHGFFTQNITDIRGKNGSYFFFEGVKNDPYKIKSLKGIDICWCEEAESISEVSWNILIPTIRKEGSEIWVSFNTGGEDDETYKRFVAPYEKDLALNGFFENDFMYVAKVSFRDNPFFPAVLKDELARDKERNYKRYLNVWEGEINTSYEDAIVQPDAFYAAIDAHKKIGFQAEGLRVVGFDPADTGDAKAVVCRYGSVVEKIEFWTTGDLKYAIDKAWDIAWSWRADVIVFDSIGVGCGVKAMLSTKAEGKSIKIEPFCGSAAVRLPTVKYKYDRANKDVFKNLRSQGYWNVVDRFANTLLSVEKRGVYPVEQMISLSSAIPEKDLAQLRSEITKIQRKKGQNNYIQIESKKDMLDRHMPSPNVSDSLVYSFNNNPVPSSFYQQLQYPKLRVV